MRNSYINYDYDKTSFYLTSVANTNNVISVLYNKTYESIADKETVEFINEFVAYILENILKDRKLNEQI